MGWKLIHARYILSQLSDRGRLYAFDQDITAINNAKIELKEAYEKGKVVFIHSNFRNLQEELAKHDVRYVDGI